MVEYGARSLKGLHVAHDSNGRHLGAWHGNGLGGGRRTDGSRSRCLRIGRHARGPGGGELGILAATGHGVQALERSGQLLREPSIWHTCSKKQASLALVCPISTISKFCMQSNEGQSRKECLRKFPPSSPRPPPLRAASWIRRLPSCCSGLCPVCILLGAAYSTACCRDSQHHFNLANATVPHIPRQKCCRTKHMSKQPFVLTTRKQQKHLYT